MAGAFRARVGSLIDNWRLPAGDSLELRTDSANDGWIAESAVTDTLRNRGYRVFIRPPASARFAHLLKLRVLNLAVHYTDLEQGGLFGSKSVMRTIEAEFEYSLQDTRTGEVLDSGTPSMKMTDRVQVDALSTLESPSIPRTQSVVPPDSFLDRAVEPFLILGAAGVAVYLLFHIRS